LRKRQLINGNGEIEVDDMFERLTSCAFKNKEMTEKENIEPDSVNVAVYKNICQYKALTRDIVGSILKMRPHTE